MEAYIILTIGVGNKMLNKYITDKAKTWKDTFEIIFKRNLDCIWETLLAKHNCSDYWENPMGYDDMYRLMWLCDMVESIGYEKIVTVEGFEYTRADQFHRKCSDLAKEMSQKSYIDKLRNTYALDAANAYIMHWTVESVDLIADRLKQDMSKLVNRPDIVFKPALGFGDIIVLFMTYANLSDLKETYISASKTSLESIQYMYTYLIDKLKDEPTLRELVIKSHNIFQIQNTFLRWNSFLLERPLIAS